MSSVVFIKATYTRNLFFWQPRKTDRRARSLEQTPSAQQPISYLRSLEQTPSAQQPISYLRSQSPRSP
jgi:hypothetical protein